MKPTKAFSWGSFSLPFSPIFNITIYPHTLVRNIKAPNKTLSPPSGYALAEKLLPIGDLGNVHAVFLKNPHSKVTIIYSGGFNWFTSMGTKRFTAIAAATQANIINYDYPGRLGTSIDKTVDSIMTCGPLLMDVFRKEGWLGDDSSVYLYGLSFGGSQAANLARAGGIKGIIFDAATPDVEVWGNSFVPWFLKPFIKIRGAKEIDKFQYFDYVVNAQVPVLLLGGKKDRVVRSAFVQRFAERLRASGVKAQFVLTSGQHNQSIYTPEAQSALVDFIAQTT